MDVSEYHNIFRQEQSHFYYVGIHQIILAQVEKNLQYRKKLTILDAGCGTGLFAKKLGKFGKVLAIDINKIAVRLAKQRGVLATRASIVDLPFTNETFDLVVSIDVLYHKDVKSDQKAIKEIYRVLKPGGLLILKVPAFNWLRGKHDSLVHTRKRYTVDNVKKLLLSNFDIKKLTYMATFLFFPAIVKRTLENFTGSNTLESDVKRPVKLLNKLLIFLFTIENFVLKFISLPFGLSVLCVATKK